MKQFLITAMYDYPEINRSVQVDAVSPHQAILRAVLNQKLAVAYARDQHGNLQPLFWQPDMAGQTRWPRFEKYNRLTWKNTRHQGQLRFEVETIK